MFIFSLVLNDIIYNGWGLLKKSVIGPVYNVDKKKKALSVPEREKEFNMEAVIIINYVISIIFTFCYVYQIFYVLVGLGKKNEIKEAKKNHSYAIVVAARNEANVIGEFIESVKNQTYDKELIDVFVVADNCTDNTAQTAREAGAVVYERENKELVGKGYALDWFFSQIKREKKTLEYEAYIVFDADNILGKDFVFEMNKVFDSGYRIITSYRNSKNYDTNWITAGYSLWFLREAKYLNNARMKLGTSCAVSGTGFLVSTDIIKENGGWVHHLLTEDIEFTTDSIIKGEKIGYCENAVLYDEQPTTLKQSYNQRLRWAKGFYQVFSNYGKKLLKQVLKGNFSSFDMLMTVSPTMLLTLISMIMNVIAVCIGIVVKSPKLSLMIQTAITTFLSFYGLIFAIGLVTTITEWKRIHCKPLKKVWYLFTFPIFQFTYVPISVIALFRKVEWTPIKHSVSKKLEDICEEEEAVGK